MRTLSALSLLSLVGPSLTQVSLPSPAIQPPPAASGAVSSATTKPNAQWSTLLNNLLYFYEAQRSGRLPSTNRVSWRNSSGLDDGSDIGKDLSGGYFDAGGMFFSLPNHTFPMLIIGLLAPRLHKMYIPLGKLIFPPRV
jgi:hypothetical protein